MTRVLVVDDEPALLEVTKTFLETKWKFDVDTALLARDALGKLEEGQYDVLVVDYQMPEMNGIAFLKRLRGAGNNVPFILFTGRGREDVAIEALNCGADFYLQKGGDPKAQFAELANMIRQSVAKRRASEDLLQLAAVVEASHDGIIGLSMDNRVSSWNAGAQTIYGYSAEEMRGEPIVKLVPEGLREEYLGLLERVKNGERIERLETERVRKDGARIMVSLTFSPMMNGSGEVTGISVVCRDVTESKLARDSLAESDAFNRAVLNALDAHISVLDRDGVIVAVNDSWERFNRENSAPGTRQIGVGSDYLGACRNSASGGDKVAQEALEGIHAVMSGEKERFTLEYLCSSPDAERWFNMTVTPMGSRMGGVVVSHKDITERRRSEKARLESERSYRTIFETTGTAMAILDERSVISLVNSEFERQSGYSRDEVEGKMTWMQFVHSDDHAMIVQRRAAHYKSTNISPTSYELRGVSKGGTVRNYLASVALIPGTKKTLVSLQNLTDRKHYEEALQQANQKLSLLGNITRHDVLNQLSVMYGYIQLAQASEKEHKVRDALGKAASASEIIRKHLEFAKDYQQMGSKRPDWIAVSEAVREAMKGFEKGRVAYDIRLKGLEVFGDQMLEKVFHNLIDNSFRHGQNVGSIKIHFEDHGNRLELYYADDGIGVPDDMKNRIFERGVGTHTGYGLYLSREILGITGITIREVGEPGKGAVFEMSVPTGKYRLKSDVP